MKDVSTLFQSATTIEIPEGLEERVFLSIQNAQQREYAFRRTLWGSLSLASLAVLAFSLVESPRSFTRRVASSIRNIAPRWKYRTCSLVNEKICEANNYFNFNGRPRIIFIL